MKKLVIALVILSFGLYATSSSAQIFKLNVTNYGGLSGNQAFVDFVNAEIKKIEDDINKDLPSAPPERLMEGMANSSVMAGKGIAGDYASNMSVFLIGAGVGAGADLAKDKNTDSDLSGVGVAPGALIGFNLGFMDATHFLGMETNRLNLYLNFMSFKKENYEVNDEPGKESYADLDTTALGFRLRYDWIKGNGSKLLGWGGVKFHFGYEYNKANINFRSKINESVNSTASTNEQISGTITGDPEAKIAVTTHSIPLELSTDVQLLYILSIFGGVGVDYNMGEAKGAGSLNAGPSSVSCTGGSCPGGTTIQVQPTANIDATGKVNPFTYRGFAGVQINLPYIRIYGQVNKAIGNDLIGANAGVRFVF